MKGEVKFFNMGKNFGFISGEDGKDYFVHLTQVENQSALNENDQVEFDATENDRGPVAENVKKL